MLARMRKASKTLSARQVFARNLRRARRLKDLSQENLAVDAGMSRAYLSGVETGARNLSIDSMGTLANALGIPLHDLVNPDKFKAPDDE